MAEESKKQVLAEPEQQEELSELPELEEEQVL